MAEAARPRLWNEGGDPADSFGAWLRRQREVREIGLREIAESSKISIRYLEALEQDRFEVLPANVFAKGFLREYARFVGLDPDEVVNYYLAARGLSEEADEEGDEEPPSARSSAVGSWILALLAAAVLVFILVAAVSSYLRSSDGNTEQRPPMAAPPVLTESLPVPNEEAPVQSSAPLRVTLDFTQNCWVEATVDGERTVSELRIQGESLRLEGEREILLTLGNVSGATIEVNGEPWRPQVADGEQIRIDRSLLAESVEGQG